jgi:Mu transposase-like protein/adenylate/guanylate cyclase family protein
VTALGADIKGSTELMEDLDPEEARAIIDPALRLMIEAVRRHGGYVVQSTGDGIFALFGAPAAYEDHPQRALYAALQMQRDLRDYGLRRVAQGGTAIEARMGVNTGEVVVRSVETGGKIEYTPIGHTINLASRLQAQLLAACHADERRQIAGRNESVGELMIAERGQLSPLVEEGFELAEIAFPRVDGLRCVQVRTNLYSVPAAPGKTVEVLLYPNDVEIRDEGRCIARHERCYERQQQVLELEHYLDVLERKPGALLGSKPLATWRARGLWPPSYDRLLADLIRRHGDSSGTRQMIQVLSLIKPYGHERVRAAVDEAVMLGCADAAAIRHLVGAAELANTRGALIEVGALSRFERPLPVLTDYDGLLDHAVAP